MNTSKKNARAYLSFILAMLLLAVLTACGQPTSPSLSDEAADNVVVLSSASLQSLSAIQEDGSLEFSDTPTEDFEVGNIIVAGVNERTPEGIAPREITSVEQVGDGYEIETRLVPLEEAVKNAEVE
jgi:hypothetical protein